MSPERIQYICDNPHCDETITPDNEIACDGCDNRFCEGCAKHDITTEEFGWKFCEDCRNGKESEE